MGTYATMTSKGQLTIPKEVRDQLHLREGTRLYVTVRNGELVASPKNKRLGDLAGALGKPPTGEVLTVEQMGEAVREVAARDDERIAQQARGERK